MLEPLLAVYPENSFNFSYPLIHLSRFPPCICIMVRVEASGVAHDSKVSHVTPEFVVCDVGNLIFALD